MNGDCARGETATAVPAAPGVTANAVPVAVPGADLIGALDVAGASVATALLVLVNLGLTGPVRILVALAFVTFVPGWAIVGHLAFLSGTARMALAAALSLTVCTMAALVMVWLEVWRPAVLLNLLGGLCFATLAARAFFGPWRPGRPSVPHRVAQAIDRRASPPTVSSPTRTIPPGAAQRRHTVRPEDLTLTDVTVHLGSSPRPEGDANGLADFYAQAHRRHRFEVFRRVGEVTFSMETEGVKRFEAGRDWASYRETTTTDFEAAKSNAVDLLGQFGRYFDLPAWTNPSVGLRAVWKPDAELVSGSGALGRMLDTDAPALARLDASSVVTVGLHVRGDHTEVPGHAWTLVIEPSPRDGQVIVNLTTEYTSAVSDTDQVGDYMQRRYDFFFDNVVRFLDSLLASDVAVS